MMQEDKVRRRFLFIVGSVTLFIILIGVTYAFFNYTRTGTANSLRTGNIYFNSDQNNTLNLTNIFPMTGTEAGNAQLDSVTVGIVGSTSYVDGEEFEITLVGVNNTINGKEIPINYIATYTATTGNTIGSSNNNYFSARDLKNANIYTLNATGQVMNGKQVLVGYVDNEGNGINGTLTIKAYIDADRIAISDTYSTETGNYIVNPNMNAEILNECVSYFSFLQSLEEGKTIEDFCNGNARAGGYTLQEGVNIMTPGMQTLEDLIEKNIVIEVDHSGGTTDEWVRGRTVLTTEEWNSLSTTPISFKIKAESQEGIWVEEPAGAPTMAETCPDCVFTYTITALWTTWNTNSQTPTVLTSSDYEEDYEDVITSSGKNFFLGLKLNGSNQIEKAYVCGLYNGTTPFCIEGYYDNSKYEANQEILQNEYLWNNTCSVQTYDEGTEYEDEETYCAPQSAGLVDAYAYSDGYVYAEVDGDGFCRVGSDGRVDCTGGE